MNEFQFHTKLDQAILLGVKARNAAGLLEGIRTVPKSSIYYHTHRFLQQHHYLSPEPPNDFAYWVTGVLNNPTLGEALSSIDIVQFHSIAALRERLEEILVSHLSTGEDTASSPQGEEFHFMASQTFVISTPYVAHDFAEFMDILQRVSIGSLYYHIFDARLRVEHDDNDFSLWFRSLGKSRLAEAVRQLDPYSQTLEGLRQRILMMGKTHGSH